MVLLPHPGCTTSDCQTGASSEPKCRGESAIANVCVRARVQRVREELRACGRLAWEVNVWALACARCPDLISRFQADHDPRLLESYPNDDKKSE